MRILFVGDLYGEAGVKMLLGHLPSIKENYRPNILIANGENAAYGRGITEKIYKELMIAGIHMITMGNWTWGNQDLFNFIDQANIVRPFNYREAPGVGYKIINFNSRCCD